MGNSNDTISSVVQVRLSIPLQAQSCFVQDEIRPSIHLDSNSFLHVMAYYDSDISSVVSFDLPVTILNYVNGNSSKF